MRNPGAAFPMSHALAPYEAWRLGWMVSELWMTSAYNIVSRTSWLSGSLPGADPSGHAALGEWQRMWSEKVLASVEMAMELQRAGIDLWLGKLDPWRSGSRILEPLHRRTVSNSRRLARRQTGR